MSNNYNCIIVDDEQDAIELLSDMIGQLYKNITIAGTYQHWVPALEAMRKPDNDLIFLDISLPGKNAMDLLRLLPDLQSEIIFITAYEQYAIDAFKFSTSGYLLKPVNELALADAISKALERVNMKRLALKQKDGASLINSKIGIPNNHGIDYVNVGDILYLESINRCTKIVTASTTYVSSYHLGKFREEVKSDRFFQVHRSFIINLNFILRYEVTGIIIMTNKAEIPVSRSVKNEFLKIFQSRGR